MREEHDTEEIAYAAQMSLRTIGKTDAAHVVKEVTAGSPSKASSYRSSIHQVRERTMTAEEALSVLIEGNYSKHQYQVARSGCKIVNSKAYPPYNDVREAKKACYPPRLSMTFTEKCGAVNLQSLLNHTVKRIIQFRESVILNMEANILSNLTLICKWGCDGTSGQNVYKQKFYDSDKIFTESNIFFTSLVPLQLTCINENKENIVIWNNPRPSSTRYCRPIKIEFLKETAETTKEQVKYVKDQEKNLVPFSEYYRGKQITVRFNLALTMVDGKVCNALSENVSTQRCYLCKATSKDFNNLDKIVELDVNEENLEFGISSLHAWIRCFECCIHLSYKLDLKKWQARGAHDKEIVNKRKADTQLAFRQQMGLIVDQPKQGFGSTNDGNTARRFFQQAKTSAEITNVDLGLIQRFHVILQVISSGREIDIAKFKKYAFETAELFVQLYPWYPMPPTIHKLLIHGPQIIASALLPIGQMSEEAQECCNKLIKKYRQDFSRKSSRTLTMEDVFCRLLLNSDPYISSVRKLPKQNKKKLNRQARKLIVHELDTDTENDDTDSSGNSDATNESDSD